MGFGFGGEFGRGFDLLFSIFPILFICMFLLIFGIIIVTIARGMKQYRKNKASPVLTVEATISDKRTDVSMGSSSHHHGAGVHHSSHRGTSYYYATFQVESGDRMELAVSGQEYGLLAPGDRGRLTFQGTRYLGFVRQ